MFPAVYGMKAASAAVPWYLAGGAPTPVAAYQPKGAVSLAASYANLANPGTNDAAPGVAPTWDAVNGWDFDGSTMYLTTGITPTTDQAYSMLIQFTNGPTSARYLAGSTGVGSRADFGIQVALAGTVAYRNGFQLAISPSITSGNLALAGNKGYRNGVAESGTIGVWIGTAADIYIGTQNNNGVPGNFAAVRIQALTIYSSTLNASQVAAVAAAMAAL